MIAGTRKGLRNRHTIFLNESLSKKLYGAAEVVGKTVMINNELTVTVAGVFRDFPNNSEFNKVTFIAPWDLMVSSYDYIKDRENDWRGNFLNIYVEISAGADFNLISERIKDIKLKHISEEKAREKPELFLHPMSQWHLYSKFENRKQVTSEQLKFVWFISLIGAFILLLASINFMNLSTARSEKRAKEVGVRKSIGSRRLQLMHQFFSESFLVVVLAFTLALVLVSASLSWFNELAGKQMQMPWTSFYFWMSNFVFILVTGLLAGSYPALYLSSFRPVTVLKGSVRAGRFASLPRKVLVVVQFTVSVTLIIGTIIVYQQLQFAKNRPVGYTREGLMMIRKTSPEFRGKSDVLSAELKNSGVVSEVAESAGTVTSIWGFNAGFDWEGKDHDLRENFGTVSVSPEYGQTVGWQFVDGRDFSKEISSDSMAFIVNETAVRYMGLQDPVGKIVKWDTEFFNGGDFTIIGVVKDMVMSSPFESSKPMIFFLQGYKGWTLLKIDPETSAHEAIPAIETVLKKIVPSAPFDYRFASDAYAAKFSTEERIGKLALVLAALAIVISCLGLFGLAAFSAEQRTKEIGIRKVLGASVTNLWQMLSKDFVVLTIISCLIAVPVAYYFMSNWLQQYEYRTALSWRVFTAACLGGIAITVLTVSWQAIRAAVANPVNSLRDK